MGRLSERQKLNEEEIKQKRRDYHKQYYKDYNKSRMKPSIIRNNIERLSRDDKYIKEFIDTIGFDKICRIAGYDCE
jgi:tyrosyl-tRNA synthetase